jgi:hypothetical protein
MANRSRMMIAALILSTVEQGLEAKFLSAPNETGAGQQSSTAPVPLASRGSNRPATSRSDQPW